MKKVIHTNNAPAAIGPYSQAIEANGMLFISGQIPVNPADGTVPEGITAQTEQVMKNIAAILDEAGYTFDNVVKTTCLLRGENDLSAQRYRQFRRYERGLCYPLPFQSAGSCRLRCARPSQRRDGRNRGHRCKIKHCEI